MRDKLHYIHPIKPMDSVQRITQFFRPVSRVIARNATNLRMVKIRGCNSQIKARLENRGCNLGNEVPWENSGCKFQNKAVVKSLVVKIIIDFYIRLYYFNSTVTVSRMSRIVERMRMSIMHCKSRDISRFAWSVSDLCDVWLEVLHELARGGLCNNFPPWVTDRE